MRVDIEDEAVYNKSLWLVYGHDAFPQLLCCRVRAQNGMLVIWGFSVYRRSPGFRTLGMDVQEFLSRHTLKEFYDDQDEALARLKKLTDCSKVK